ncbi:hypothetical protein J7K76_04120 [Candidatus Bipolaricaulota bacterium]|nr:hypothetical protein [Candidatus Bipolaricaulota bacterium]
MMTSRVKERLHELIESVPDEVLEELLDDIEDILALLEAKGEDEGARIPWEKAREELDIEES